MKFFKNPIIIGFLLTVLCYLIALRFHSDLYSFLTDKENRLSTFYPILLGLGASSFAFCVYIFETRNAFVDNRKALLFDLLSKEIDEEPAFAQVIQAAGKERKLTEYLMELFYIHNPTVFKFYGEILSIRKQFKIAHIISYILFFTTINLTGIPIFIFLLHFYTSSTFYLIFAIFIALCILLIILNVIIGGGNLIPFLQKDNKGILKKRRISSTLFYDIVLGYFYRHTFKDRSSLSGHKNRRNQSFETRYQTAVDEIRLTIENTNRSDIRVVDLGCGDGQLEARINFVDITGIDISEKSIKVARENTFHKGHKFIEGNIIKYEQFQAKHFKIYDMVILIEVVEHFLDPVSRLKEIVNFYLKNDGIVIFTLPAIESARNRKAGWEMKANLYETETLESETDTGAGKLFIEHFWLDNNTGLSFPHRLYSEEGVLKMCKYAFETKASIAISKILLNEDGEFDTYLVKLNF